jgi:hypothetical protein
MICYHQLSDEEKAFIIEMFKNVKFSNLSLESKEKPYILREPSELRYVRDSVALKSLQGYRKHIIKKQPPLYAEILPIVEGIIAKLNQSICDGTLETTETPKTVKKKKGKKKKNENK